MVTDIATEETLIEITPAAQAHFERLISKENVEGMALRIYVVNLGTPRADVGLTFCPPGRTHYKRRHPHLYPGKA